MSAVPSPSPVEVFDRASGEIKTEAIYGEGALRFAYETAVGRAGVELFAKRALFSRLYGWWMSRPASRAEVPRFIERFGLDAGEFLRAPEEFESFNAFFSRELKPGARPVDPAPESVVFPADGRHLGFANVAEAGSLYAKGQRFDLPALLGDAELAGRFREGSAVISRLCPVDYHRFHFPAAGTPGKPRLVNGVLYSVNPVALRRGLRYLAENKRILTRFQSEVAGEILILEIGATNVGSIAQTHAPGMPVAKGAEKGCFAFGGSMTMLFFEPGRVKLDGDLLEQSAAGRELYARMGERLGEALQR